MQAGVKMDTTCEADLEAVFVAIHTQVLAHVNAAFRNEADKVERLEA